MQAFGANCFMGIGYHLRIPIIAVSTNVEYPWISHLTGNNDNPAVVPNNLFSAFGELNFWQRLKNTIMYHNKVREFHWKTEKAQTEAMRKYISPDLPSIREVEKSVALTLVNSHPIISGIKPLLPNLVQVAGIHIKEKVSSLPSVILALIIVTV